MQPSETFNMAIGPGQPATSPGAFGTPDPINSQSTVWNELAVKHSWKPDGVDRVVTYQVIEPVKINFGSVGPQIEKLPDGTYSYLKGGNNQIELLVPRDDRIKYIKPIDVNTIE